jgi:hypothetical protein
VDRGPVKKLGPGVRPYDQYGLAQRDKREGGIAEHADTIRLSGMTGHSLRRAMRGMIVRLQRRAIRGM